MNSPSVNIWSHVFPTIYLSIAYNVLMYNSLFNLFNLCYRNSFLYHLFVFFISDLIGYRIVYGTRVMYNSTIFS